ncbi:MAG: response regulator [Thiomargarita sp.]|nr:response regulator [Thiomargarita sp.]
MQNLPNDLPILADEDDLLLLAEEDEIILPPEKHVEYDNQQIPVIDPYSPTWKIIIVDDEQEIHDVTKIALDGFKFKDKPISFISAYSGKQAKTLLKEHPDTAIVFLDVVMEENDSGLQVVKYIRETLQNQFVRIILRTGQPGEAPEEKTIINYDINDYKHKAELTRRKLFVTTISGLRSYYDLMLIETNKTALKQTLEAIPIGICVLDAQTVKPKYINKEAQKIFGNRIETDVSIESIVDMYKLYTAGTYQTYPYEKLPMVRALNGETTHVDDIEIRQNNQNIPIESWGTPIYANDKIIYSLATFQDITERQQAEANKTRMVQEREAKNVALHYSKEIEAKNLDLVKLNQDKNEFLGIATHDLKNPLSAIMGCAEEIEECCNEMSREEIAELSGLIKQASTKMSTLITNLLDVNQIESGQIKLNLADIDILSIVKNIAQDYTKRAKEKNIAVHFSHEGSNFQAHLDADAVGQILDNIISNAVKYSPLGKNIYIKLIADKDKIRCEVKNEGEGLNEADQKKLFGKFNRLTTKPTGKEHSNGLGLFIVKKLAEAMNAKVWCESKLSQGATFIIEFKTL